MRFAAEQSFHPAVTANLEFFGVSCRLRDGVSGRSSRRRDPQHSDKDARSDQSCSLRVSLR
jgi:hypothetical protein